MKLIDMVTLLEVPSESAGPFYVVEGTEGKYYVSSLGGRAARGLPAGTQLKLYTNKVSPQMSAYVLERA
jgi:hypothetical protein